MGSQRELPWEQWSPYRTWVFYGVAITVARASSMVFVE